MKRKIIIILCLVLSLVLSCEKDVLDRVLIQGGMDAQYPMLVVATDPDEEVEATQIVLNSKDNSTDASTSLLGESRSEYDDRSLFDEKLAQSTGVIIDHIDKSNSENIALFEKSVKNAVDSSLDKKFSEYDEKIPLFIESSVTSSFKKNISLLSMGTEESVDDESASKEEEVSSSIVSMGQSISTKLHESLSSAIKSTIRDQEEDTKIKDKGDLKDSVSIYGIEYSLTENGYMVTGYEEGLNELVISEEIDGVPVISIKAGAFKGAMSFKGDVILPKSLMAIGSEAFMSSGFDGNIYIPSSLVYIGDRAFYNSGIQGDLIIPSSVVYMGEMAFGNCRRLGDSVFGGGGLEEVGERVFESSGVKYSYLPPAISEKLGF